MILKLNFYECEHHEDLENYAEDIKASGGTIIKTGLDYEDETGWIEVKIENKIDFLNKFKETPTYEYIT